MPLHSIASVTLGVPRLDASAAFYAAFGLISADGRSFATRDGGEQLRLVEAGHRGLQRLTVGVDHPDDLAAAAARLTAGGHPVTIGAGTVATVEPVTQLPIELRVTPRIRPTKLELPMANSPGAIVRTDEPAPAVMASWPVHPSRLSHLVFGTPDQPATLAFFTDVLGFLISDQIPGIIAFTRCSDSHHDVAIQLAPCPLLHHVAFEVDSVDDVARGGTALIDADPARQLWGLGRHAIGSNWFWYLKEPSGTFVEYTADLDRITAQDLYVPKAWSGHEYLYAFGSPPPREFMEPADIGELLAAQAG